MEEEELQERRREIQARVISGQVMHHSADPSTEAAHQRRRDRCDCSNRVSENEAERLPGQEADEYYMLSLVLVRQLGHRERIWSFIRHCFNLLSSDT